MTYRVPGDTKDDLRVLETAVVSRMADPRATENQPLSVWDSSHLSIRAQSGAWKKSSRRFLTELLSLRKKDPSGFPEGPFV